MYIRNKAWHVLKCISSLRFSIGLFLALAVISVIGTLIDQDQPIEYYKLNYSADISIFAYPAWRIIIALGLNHAYSTYWFLTLLVFFFLSLLLCTFSTQLPMLRSARRWNFLYGQTAMKSKALYRRYPYSSFSNLTFVLSLRNYCIFHKGYSLYGYKGLVGRLAPIFVHLGIIFTLIGSVLGFTNGFMAQEMVPSSEVFHVQNFVKAGYFSSLPTNFSARVDDFFLTFNSDNSIKQFFSSISLVDSKGNVLASRAISVNKPLKFYGSTFYQTDWKLNALRIDIGSNRKSVKPISHSTSAGVSSSLLWFSTLHLDKAHTVFVVIPVLNNELLIYDSEGFLIKTTNYGLCNVIYGVPVTFKDLIFSTGLQVKVDPGVDCAYFGFLILILSILLSYTSYSQIWLSSSADNLYFAGETNRARLTFENEVAILQKKYADLSQLNC